MRAGRPQEERKVTQDSLQISILPPPDQPSNVARKMSPERKLESSIRRHALVPFAWTSQIAQTSVPDSVETTNRSWSRYLQARTARIGPFVPNSPFLASAISWIFIAHPPPCGSTNSR